jgi:flavodoxin I
VRLSSSKSELGILLIQAMRSFTLLLVSLACGLCDGRRVLQSKQELVEVFVMDRSNAGQMQSRISEHAKYWASRGKKMTSLGQCNRRSSKSSRQSSLLELNSLWNRPGRVRSHSVKPVAAAPRASLPQMSVGLYYSTSTGNTETVAGYIADKTGIEDWKDIADADEAEILGHDGIIVGAPTWHTGADEQRSGTSWDDWLYDQLPNMDFSGKKVAIFGVGDSGSYSDNFCDATGELYDCFTAKGAEVYGMTPSDEGFDYVESKSVRDGKFVGKTFDEDNYPDESEGRVDAWLEQLKSEGFM